MEETTGWDCKEGTPAGLCKSSRAVVSVKNLIADSRFPELSYNVLGTEGHLSALAACHPSLPGRRCRPRR